MAKVMLAILATLLAFPALAAAAEDPVFSSGWREPAVDVMGTFYDFHKHRTTSLGGYVEWCLEAEWEDPELLVKACSKEIENHRFQDPFKLATRYYNRGNGYFDLKRYDKAFSDYSKAIELYGDMPYFYNNRGLVSYMNGEYAAAVDDFDKRIELDVMQVNIKTYINRGDAYFRMGKYAEAIRSYSAAIKEPPRSFLAVPYNSLGYKHDERLAEADCRTAIAGTYYKRGLAYRKRGELQKAVADTEKSLEIMRSSTSVCAEKEDLP